MSRGHKDRSGIPRKLRALGGVQVHKSLWKISERKVGEALSVLREKQVILLRRTRDVKRVKYARGVGVKDIGGLVVVAYDTSAEVIREKIANFFKNGPLYPFMSLGLCLLSDAHPI